MADKTAIEWADATWNPTTGCTKVSPGCDHCYAERIVERFKGKGAFEQVTLNEERLTAPLRWRKPRRVFVNSMSDLFHDGVPDLFIDQVFDVMEQAKQHTFQVLTKRHARMRAFVRAREKRLSDYARKFDDCPTEEMRNSPAAQMARQRAANPPANIWLGVSVEDQKWADIRIPALLGTPAAVRFLSCEPLLGPINLQEVARVDSPGGGWSAVASLGHGEQPRIGVGIDWVIVGGESGPGARPMHPDWARSLRDQCTAAGVPFFYKQRGEWKPAPSNYGPDVPDRARAATALLFRDGSDMDGQIMLRAGKHRAGRELDGRTWDEYPEVRRA